MSSIEDQIKEMVINQQYDHIDKNMSIGCGDPFKNELSRIIGCYLDELLQHFELTHKPVVVAKRAIFKEIVNEVNELAEKHRGNAAIAKLQVRIQGFGI